MKIIDRQWFSQRSLKLMNFDSVTPLDFSDLTHFTQILQLQAYLLFRLYGVQISEPYAYIASISREASVSFSVEIDRYLGH